MTQGAFVLIGGRFGDVYGHKIIMFFGAVFWVLWSIATGFASSVFMMALFRALSGIGSSFTSPNAVALLMHTFPPGKMRNISMGLFAAMAPIGMFTGGIVAAGLMEYAEWKWVFFFL